MKAIVDFDYKKGTQALNFFAQKEGGAIDKLKVLKLIWLADRYHLRKYGRPIVNDVYFAMKLGPVASNVKDLTEDPRALDDAERSYLQAFLSCDTQKNLITTKKIVDVDVFSETDLEALERVYEAYGSYKAPSLVELAHDYPEWKKFEISLTTGASTRENMSYSDFFLNPQKTRFKNIFTESDSLLEVTKEVFKDNYIVASFWQ